MKYALLIGAQISIGAAAIFARFALSGAGPIAVAAARLTIAATILLAIAALASDARVRVRAAEMRVFIAAGLALAVHFATWIGSLQFTSVAVSTLLVSTTPVWTALYDWAIRKQRFGLRSLGALALGAAGLYVVTTSNTGRAPIPGHPALGESLAVIGALAIGVYLLLVRGTARTLSTRVTVTHTYSVAALALVVGAGAAGQAPPALDDGAAWGGIFGMAILAQLCGHTALNAALRWFSPSAVAFSTVLEPLAAALLAFAVFGERLTGATMAGGGLLLVAIGVFLWEDAARTAI